MSAGELQALTRAAGARCQCDGQCGGNHQWLPTQPAKRCGAPIGCNIRRKKDNPSYWQLAESDVSGPMAYPDFFRPGKDNLIEVKFVVVELVELGSPVKKVFCERCAEARKRKLDAAPVAVEQSAKTEEVLRRKPRKAR